jgi:Ion channel
MPMLVQLALGSVLMLLSIVIAGVSFWVMEVALLRFGPWLARRPHRPKLPLILMIAAVWIMAQLTVGVWIWALTLWSLDIFQTIELSVYFSLVAFTTLGFGDVLLPQEWRLLAGMAAANGLLNMGMLTALLVEGVRQVREVQLSSIRADP